jgi:hypothetical protein
MGVYLDRFQSQWMQNVLLDAIKKFLISKVNEIKENNNKKHKYKEGNDRDPDLPRLEADALLNRVVSWPLPASAFRHSPHYVTQCPFLRQLITNHTTPHHTTDTIKLGQSNTDKEKEGVRQYRAKQKQRSVEQRKCRAVVTW